MLTITITNRNRDSETVRRAIESLEPQLSESAKLVVVDYGSDVPYQAVLREYLKKFKNISLIICPTQKQLWHKSRAINVVLRTCRTPYFMVADMDMIFHPAFVERALELARNDAAIYFAVGLLSERETTYNKEFLDYRVESVTNEIVRGMTLYPTSILKEIRGYDELYHSWGGEDTDVHTRLRNAGHKVIFWKEEILLKHQWHGTRYRSRGSLAPFHGYLERVNAALNRLSVSQKRTLANSSFEWGVLPAAEAYKALERPDHQIDLWATRDATCAALLHLSEYAKGKCIRLTIHKPPGGRLENTIRHLLGKRAPHILSMLIPTMDEVNDRVLEYIILNHRNSPYSYDFDRKANRITLVISFAA